MKFKMDDEDREVLAKVCGATSRSPAVLLNEVARRYEAFSAEWNLVTAIQLGGEYVDLACRGGPELRP